jgi:hypothetical protein
VHPLGVHPVEIKIRALGVLHRKSGIAFSGAVNYSD